MEPHDATTGPDLTGRVLDGRYRVEAALGRGGMGTVYLAHDERMRRKVVVKIPHARFLADPGFRERFEREITSLTTLDHPHVVKALDVGHVDGAPYAVLQYLPGGNLSDRIAAQGGRQSPEEVTAWLGPVAAALDFIHRQGVVHRDVKPANVLFDGQHHAFLADFGIAKALGPLDTSLTETGMTLGSPDYMAPEQGMAESVTGAADQYALATVVYVALAGRLPFQGDSPVAVLTQRASRPAPPLRQVAPHLSVAIEEVLARALEREPDRRYASCSAFSSAFEQAAREPGAVLAGPTPEGLARATTGPTSTRPPRLWIGLGLAAATAVTVAIVLSSRDAPRSAGSASTDADSSPPTIVVEHPPGEVGTYAGPVATLRGTASDDRELKEVRVGGEPVKVDGGGAFEVQVTLPEVGQVEVVVDAVDRAGNRSTAVRRVLRRRERPWASSVQQATEAAKTSDWPAVRRLFDEARRRGAVEEDLPAALTAGLSAWEAPPVLVVEDPVDGAVLLAGDAAARGTLGGARSTDRVLVNGEVAPVREGRFDARMDLAEGEHEVRVVVADGALQRTAPVVRHVRVVARWQDSVRRAQDAAARGAVSATAEAVVEARSKGAPFERLGPDVRRVLASGLGSAQASDRGAALRALAAVGPDAREFVEPAIRSLETLDFSVSDEAVAALAAIGVAASDALVRYRYDDVPRIPAKGLRHLAGVRAEEALRRIGPPALPAVLKRLPADESTPCNVVPAEWSPSAFVVTFGSDAVPHVLPSLGSADRGVRLKALYLLMRLKGPVPGEAVPLLVEMLRDDADVLGCGGLCYFAGEVLAGADGSALLPHLDTIGDVALVHLSRCGDRDVGGSWVNLRATVDVLVRAMPDSGPRVVPRLVAAFEKRKGVADQCTVVLAEAIWELGHDPEPALALARKEKAPPWERLSALGRAASEFEAQARRVATSSKDVDEGRRAAVFLLEAFGDAAPLRDWFVSHVETRGTHDSQVVADAAARLWSLGKDESGLIRTATVFGRWDVLWDHGPVFPYMDAVADTVAEALAAKSKSLDLLYAGWRSGVARNLARTELTAVVLAARTSRIDEHFAWETDAYRALQYLRRMGPAAVASADELDRFASDVAVNAVLRWEAKLTARALRGR